MAPRLTQSLLAALVCTELLAGQTLLYETKPAATNPAFTAYGAEITALDDIDGDGTGDFIVGAPGIFETSPGGFTVHSGASGAILLEVAEPVSDELSRVGWALESIADLDGDGLRDIVSGTPGGVACGFGGCGGSARGEVRFYSSAGGALLERWLGAGADDSFGYDVAVLGDIDNDGIIDLAVGAPQRTVFGDGYVEILSGADGTSIMRLDSGLPGDQFGTGVHALGDVTGDGRTDIAVFARAPSGSVFVGRIDVLELDGTLVWSVEGAPGDQFGSEIASADVNADGVPDVVVNQNHSVRVFSGDTGAMLLDVANPTSFPSSFGTALEGMGDLDGDGHEDVLVGIDRNTVVAWILSGADGSLRALYTPSFAGVIFGDVGAIGDVDGDGLTDIGLGITAIFSLGGATTFAGTTKCLVYSSRTIPFVPLDEGGVPGQLGTPILRANGSTTTNQQVSLEVGNAAPFAPAYLVLGETKNPLATFSPGQLVPTPSIVIPLVTDAHGRITITDRWPNVPAGFMLFAQAWIVDATGTLGWSATNGLQLTASGY